MTWSFPMDEDGGFIVIDKPKGPTSHQIDYWVREITGIAKVGHVGTLDPQARTRAFSEALRKAYRENDQDKVKKLRSSVMFAPVPST